MLGKFVLLLILSFWFPFGGSKTRYANVHIEAKCIENDVSVLYKVYDGGNGLYLGTTPLDLPLSRKSKKEGLPLSLLVRQGEDGSPTYWKIVVIENWSKTPREAMDAYRKNDVLFRVKCN